MNKTIIGLIIAGILLISIPVGVRLVQQQQILKSKAAVVYNNPCGDAQKCADPETEGDPGRILCTNSCGTATNSCRTERSCGTPIGCQSKDDCTQNVSCPTGCTGTEVLCDTGVEGGICYS